MHFEIGRSTEKKTEWINYTELNGTLFGSVVDGLLCRHQQQFYRRHEQKYCPKHFRRSPPDWLHWKMFPHSIFSFSDVYVYLCFRHITTFSTDIWKCRLEWQKVFWTTNFRRNHRHMIHGFGNAVNCFSIKLLEVDLQDVFAEYISDQFEMLHQN